MTSHESSWPGERDPSRHDVESANELPEPSVLSNFKTTLLSSQDAEGNEKLMRLNLISRAPEQKRFTYPASLLSNFPHLPDNEDLVSLRQIFTNACSKYPFFNRLSLPPLPRKSISPPLYFALACLGSVYARRSVEESRDLFLAGTDLWVVMMEVDNREARRLDMLSASLLLTMYGMLTTEETIWKRSTLMLSSSITIACRMRLQDPSQLGDFQVQRSSHATVVWILWLVDVVQGLHLNSPPHFSSGELWTKMPSSGHDFQDVYRALMQESISNNAFHNARLPEATSREDALLLLVAILSDSICLRRSLGRIVSRKSSTDLEPYHHNPFVPFSPQSEYDRLQGLLSTALERWHRTFNTLASAEMLALYCYCKLHLSCPELPILSQLAGYGPLASAALPQFEGSGFLKELRVSHESTRLAWLVLDNVASPARTTDVMCPIWLPVVVFHAALVIWGKISLVEESDNDRYGSTRALLAFQVELENMCWPCCVDMVATLKRLITSATVES